MALLTYRAAGGKIRLATSVIFLRRHSRGMPCGMICYRTVDVSAAVAPVDTRWGSRFTASVLLVHIALTSTTDCLGDVGPVRTRHVNSMESSTSKQTPPSKPSIHLGYYPYPDSVSPVRHS